MSFLFGDTGDFFGLDIGSTGIRLVELKPGGGNAKTLVKYAFLPLDSTIAMSDAKGDQQKLGQAVSQLVSQARLSTKNVAVGITSSRVFTTIATIDRLPESELTKAIPLQADSLIP